MARYIDVDKLIAEYDRVHIGPAGGARKLMVEAPTADVVKVVRCKDCRHAREMNRREKQLYLEGCVMCSQVDINGEQNPMLPDDFCSYGELKEGEGE